MANPKRETKRERRDEAKRRRLEELKRRQRKARMRRMLIWGGVGAALAGIIALVVVLGGGGGNPAESNRLAAAAGCDQVQNPAKLENKHINPGERATYNTNPPSSGSHYNAAGLGPITTGIHRSTVSNEGFVHNLEHGHIAFFYKETVSQEIATILADVVRDDSRWLLLAPNNTMPFEVAFTSWGHLQGCNTPNAAGLKAAAEDFVKRFKDKSGLESAAGVPEPGTDTAVPPVSTASPSASPTATPTSPSPSPTST